MDRQRLDKWIWHARIVKSRSDAQALIAAGHVRVNATRITSAAHALRSDDVLTIALDQRVRVVRVTGFAERRGGAAEARSLYCDLATPPRGDAG